MSSSYYLIGPISKDAIFTYSQGGVSYFLTLVKGESDDDPYDLIFDPRATGDTNTIKSPLILNSSAGTNAENSYSLTFTDPDNKITYITADKKHTIAIPTSKKTALIVSQNEVNPWNRVPFLAGVHYTFHTTGNDIIKWKTYEADNSENGLATSVVMEDGSPKISTYTGSIRVIITPWYEDGSCATTTEQAVTILEASWVSGGTVPNGFTNSSDCSVGIRYKYCPPKQNCNTSCKGPCPLNDNDARIDCFYETKKSGFVCEDPPANEPWYKQPWFIIGAILVGILFAVLFLLLIVRFSRKEPVKGSTSK